MSTLSFFRKRKVDRFQVRQPETTYTGARIYPPQKGLPKITQSLCPECTSVIDARVFEEDGAVFMEKTCPQHGYCKDLILSDAKLYYKMQQWGFGDNRGLANPAVPNAARCPEQCGLCGMHTSHTGLANIDLTNRCNLTCPVCFANANAAGYLYEPSLEYVRKMLTALRSLQPCPARVIQFSGGEPTIYPHFFEALKMAREVGFTHIQCATNGLAFSDIEFAAKAKESGLHTLYLQLDGTLDTVYQRTRGEELAAAKLKCIENVKAVGLKIVFVPTIVKGVNDHQIGDIIRLALQNIECISGISFQPVAFTGRIARRQREAMRFTLSDLARCVEEQTGLADRYRDWYPLAFTSPFSRLVSAIRGSETMTLTCHPNCSMGTYFFVDQDRNATPVTKFLNCEEMMKDMDLLARKTGSSSFKFYSQLKAWNSLRRHFNEKEAPKGLTFKRFLATLQGFTDKRYGRGAMDGTYTYKTLMVAGMHFMDHYNYDVERVKRCVIHYAAPNGIVYPFCAYNSGPTFREKIEKRFSVPIDIKEVARGERLTADDA
ncbi:MAG: tetraether lipid synthase Tes [Acidobacteriota bacterium]